MVDTREQCDAKLLLQPLDPARQCRLSDPQMRRRTGDAAKVGDPDEIEQAAPFHRAKLSPAMPA